MDNAGLFRSSTSQSSSLDLRTILSKVQNQRATFKSRAQWRSSLNSGTWQSGTVEITSTGSLLYLTSSQLVQSAESVNNQGIVNNELIMEHLQSCVLQIIEQEDQKLPIIKVETPSASAYLRVYEAPVFEALFCTLLWWGALKREGIFSKTTLQPPELTQESPTPVKVLVSNLFVFGPLPSSKNIAVIKHMSRPNFLPQSDAHEAWFPAMGVLKSDGVLDLLLQSDGTLLYSLDITRLTRSEIRMIDPSLRGENYLFLGVLPQLRNELDITTNCGFIRNGRNTKMNSGIIFKFPLAIDVEDWIVALKSFALSESISLIASHQSNKFRISNRFKVSIIEGDIESSNDSQLGSNFYVDCLLWGRIWARTPIVSNSFTPFWREEFFFEESNRIDCLRIELKQRNKNSNKHDITVGFIELSQKSISDGSLSKETRLPIVDFQDGKTKIGTLCVKVISSLNFVLPGTNFINFEKILSEGCLKSLATLVNDSNFGYDFKFEDFAMVLLDIFQAMQKENAWFGALIDKELVDVDGSITRNTRNNKTSSHIYSTLFRGNSPLTKSIEKYFYRLGKEYLNKSIGDILRQIVYSGISCEVDPSRLQESDPLKKEEILERNRALLIDMVERIWTIIYNTSNDLPLQMKMQMKTFRNKLELLCMDEDSGIILNCVSGLLFLRFFCPVILNPKLFDFVNSHLNATSRRTLTLISKVLLNLSNIAYFGKKEPYMIELNSFIDAHKDEVLEYVDKVTQKKLDFSSKTLKLSNTMARPKMVVNEGILSELPTNPYLIDRYLRETELFTALSTISMKRDGDSKIVSSVSIEEISKNIAHVDISEGKEVANIGELEFEKITQNNTEVFGDDLMKYLENEKNASPEHDEFVQEFCDTDNIKDLEQASILLFHRSEHLKKVFSDFEVPMDEVNEKVNYFTFLVENSYFTNENKVFVNENLKLGEFTGISKLYDSATGRSKFLENLLSDCYMQFSEKSSIRSSQDSVSSTKTRGFTRLKSTKLRKKLAGVSEESGIGDSRSSIKKWLDKIR